MSTIEPQTVGESLFWSYANLAMKECMLKDGAAQPAKVHFIIRSRLYAGLRKNTMQVRGFFDDERLKLQLPHGCWYCGKQESLSADHLIPRAKGGGETGENLVYSCRRCNSSKGSRDLLEWMSAQGLFPPLYLLRRYLKIAIFYCFDHDLLTTPLSDCARIEPPLPFSIAHVPHRFPAEVQLFATSSELSSRTPALEHEL